VPVPLLSDLDADLMVSTQRDDAESFGLLLQP